MDDHHVSAVTVIDEWEDCRVAHIPTIPIVLTVDFDRLEQNGRQAEARTASGPISSFSKTRIFPVRTLVAERKSLIGQCALRIASKSTVSQRIERRGWMSKGLSWYGENNRVMISNRTKAGDVSSDWLPVNRSNGVGCRGLSKARVATRRQMSASTCRAPARPPTANP